MVKIQSPHVKSALKLCLMWHYRKLDQIDSAVELNDLRVPPGNRLEALKGDRTAFAQHSD